MKYYLDNSFNRVPSENSDEKSLADLLANTAYGESSGEEDHNAEQMMDLCMSELWVACIEPMQEKLDEEQRNTIGLIGMTLKVIAQKARCYENLQELGKLSGKYRN